MRNLTERINDAAKAADEVNERRARFEAKTRTGQYLAALFASFGFKTSLVTDEEDRFVESLYEKPWKILVSNIEKRLDMFDIRDHPERSLVVNKTLAVPLVSLGDDEKHIPGYSSVSRFDNPYVSMGTVERLSAEDTTEISSVFIEYTWLDDGEMQRLRYNFDEDSFNSLPFLNEAMMMSLPEFINDSNDTSLR